MINVLYRPKPLSLLDLQGDRDAEALANELDSPVGIIGTQFILGT